MEVSDDYSKAIYEIRSRVINSGCSFRANENISEFIKPGDLDEIQSEVEKHLYRALFSLVIDTANDHNTRETARRVAKMWVREIFAGRYDPTPVTTSFPNIGYDDLYTTGPITIRSMCAHHLVPITGSCWVGIHPVETVIGLSKFNRIVNWIASRPQIQEEMTSQIADALEQYAETPNVAVVVKAEHACMCLRGVKEHDSTMSTAVMRGDFRSNPSLKDEFYKLVNFINL